MGATSVTGVSGPGDSHGVYKPDLHCGGCSCSCQGDNCEPPTVRPRESCYIAYRSNGGFTFRSGTGSVTIRGC